jgi:hypothetical protein
MKVSLLLLFAAIGFASANAQVSPSTDFKNILGTNAEEISEVRPINKSENSKNKTTLNSPEWFRYVDILYVNGISKGYSNIIYQDSNLVYQDSVGMHSVSVYGMGVSFDPSDSVFFSSTCSAGLPDPAYQPSFCVRDTNNYWIDSLAFPMKYYRTQNTIDTLIIQLAKVNKKYPSLNPQGLLSLQLSASTGNYITGWFDSLTNRLSTDIPSTAVTTFKIPLNSAFYGDTTISGYSRIAATGFSVSHYAVPPNNKVIAWITFKSGINYSPGTSISNSNHIRLYSYDLAGFGASPIQNGNSYYSGLVATTQIKYEEFGDYTNNGHSILIPSVYYPTERYLTDIDFKVDCPTSWGSGPNCTTGIEDPSDTKVIINTYPNPVNEQIILDVKTLKNTRNYSLTIYNSLGSLIIKNIINRAQSKIKVSTESWSNGVYYYTITMDGINYPGRFVVLH